jgi:hypothetical protein
MNDIPHPSDPIARPEVQAALAIFYKELGKTIASWSRVEDGLFEWFKQCTGMREQLARAVFYSSRSFEGRSDMLLAAIPLSSCNEKMRTAIRLCVKRARQYSAFRNRISHGHIIFVKINDVLQPVLNEGQTYAVYPGCDYVTLRDLEIVGYNFRELSYLILGFHPEYQAPDVCELGCLEEIRALPIAANSTVPGQN